MENITGIGQRPLAPINTTRSQDFAKSQGMGQRPAAPQAKYDKYSPSEAAVAAFSMVAEEEDEVQETETLFDYMDEEIDYDALGISEEDMDFSEYDEFAAITEDGEEVVEESDLPLEDSDEEFEVDAESGDLVLGEVEEEEDVETDTEEDSSDVTVYDDSDRVHGYKSSLTEEDRAMMAIAYQASQILTMQGETLFDYLGDDTGWFDTDWNSGTSNYSDVDWDSLLSAFGDITGTTTEDDEDDSTVEDSDVIDPVEDEDVVEADVSTDEVSETESVSEEADAVEAMVGSDDEDIL